jgi:hypothetical protein
VHGKRRDALVFSQTREQVQRRAVREQSQRPSSMPPRRALPCGVVRALAHAPPCDCIYELIHELAMGPIVHPRPDVRREDSCQRIQATVVPRTQRAANLAAKLVAQS